MKKTQILLALVSFVILSACHEDAHHYEFWNTSKFKLDSTVLHDNDEIKLIYTSGAPDDNKDLRYYIHVIAVSQKSGDTINILTPLDNGFNPGDGDKVYNFVSEDNIAYKLMQRQVAQVQEPAGQQDISHLKAKRIDRVARDPRFDKIADNNYPTVIGTIGIFTPPTGN